MNMTNVELNIKDRKKPFRLNVAELARIIGKSRTYTWLVLYDKVPGKRTGEPTRLAILKALRDLGIEVEYKDLWPNDHERAA